MIDFQAISSNDALFEGVDISGCTPQELMNAKKLYNYIVESKAIADENGIPLSQQLDEGVFGALIGGLTGATIMPTIMKAVCKVLGIDEKGTLGNLLTSRVVLAALGGQLGYNI